MAFSIRQRSRALWKRWERSSRNPLGTIVSVRTSEPLVALTFDDGPDPEFTPALLEILARHGAKATFFMVGERANTHWKVVKQVAAAGHTIGNHTADHPSLPTLSGRERRRQIRHCRAALGPHATDLFRPPFGHQTRASKLDAWFTGHQVVGWGSHVEDWTHQPAHVLASRLQSAFAPGRIVLLHDGICGGTDPAASDRTPMLGGLDRALSRALDFEFVTLPELFRRGTPHRANWVSGPLP
ncbi:MAG: polysaccharide deacetylase family protein [Longimicrobiales bacterium]